jgi:hypothetical protein
MKVAVVTPYFEEPISTLERCCASVSSQTHPCEHFLVADGPGRPEIAHTHARHIQLPLAHGNNGDTPRAIGGICAVAEGFDVVTYLDADNWYDSNHIELIAEALTGDDKWDVICTQRKIWLANGTFCPFEDDDVTNRLTADTSSIVFANRGLGLVSSWGLIPNPLSPICDRVMISLIDALGLSVKWSDHSTVNYESRWPNHYAALGLAPPADAHDTNWEAIEMACDGEIMKCRFGLDPFLARVPNRKYGEPRVVPKICETR